jgi:hypothetical protein
MRILTNRISTSGQPLAIILTKSFLAALTQQLKRAVTGDVRVPAAMIYE